MMRPRKMKQVELTVLDRDVDRVIEFLGRRAVMHLSDEAGTDQGSRGLNGTRKHIRENLEKLQTAAVYLGCALPSEPDESS
ncbi:MAG: V-type ATP synthase subunit I, partial [Spirochaetaceae bacterium]|nr:V-type ATP synthase subunit I [Spirochaetaceae bacterium]